ncbi:methyltransferase domain-containing protein [Candidatus Uabimicrobium amorphum]|uniref:tRNA (adenine(58)-N(1))-methyltransferase TrmI n=1 Tax=Uabimicrobium amorphum TaxID=2596890 RepID=A0A5S9ILB7_UABAM|nr:methyltransferase domain-containing protein [Candidatus Uabimicrobium amorphum]BBM83546.1 SAM-dependent methyltransferase [Candidatus Uabimicrobium amorphum]
MIRRILFPKRSYLIRDCRSHFHCAEGSFSPEDLQKESGSQITTTTGNTAYILDADFLDTWECIKRKAQIMISKDLGWIVCNTSIDKTKVVVDAGTGSGGCCCFLAYYAKHVFSYDLRDDHVRLGEKNAHMLGLDNLTIKCHDITKSIPQKNVDVIILDIPQPWDAIELASEALKIGGYVVTYSPSTHQVQETVVSARSLCLWHLKTIELQEREWCVDHNKCRPEYRGLGHTGFLSLFRKYRPYRSS